MRSSVLCVRPHVYCVSVVSSCSASCSVVFIAFPVLNKLLWYFQSASSIRHSVRRPPTKRCGPGLGRCAGWLRKLGTRIPGPPIRLKLVFRSRRCANIGSERRLSTSLSYPRRVPRRPSLLLRGCSSPSRDRRAGAWADARTGVRSRIIVVVSSPGLAVE